MSAFKLFIFYIFGVSGLPSRWLTDFLANCFLLVPVLQTEHNTADDNVVIKLTKQPMSTWGEHPTPSRVTRIGGTIDDLLGTMRAAEDLAEGKTLAAKDDGEERLVGDLGADFEALAHDID